MHDGQSDPREAGRARADDERARRSLGLARGAGAGPGAPDDEIEWVLDEESLEAPLPLQSAEPAEPAPPLPTPTPAPSRPPTVEDAGQPDASGEDEEAPEPVDIGDELGDDAEDTAEVVPLSDDAERAALLTAVLRSQALNAIRWDTEPPRRTSTPVKVAAAILVLLAGWLWISPPGWLQPAPPPPVSPQVQEAGLRLAMYIQAQQIEAFRLRRGRLPDVLWETGEPLPGMIYQRLNAREYRLTGFTEAMALTYRSTEPLAQFVGNIERTIGVGSDE